jgi:hypothetical protein
MRQCDRAAEVPSASLPTRRQSQEAARSACCSDEQPSQSCLSAHLACSSLFLRAHCWLLSLLTLAQCLDEARPDCDQIGYVGGSPHVTSCSSSGFATVQNRPYMRLELENLWLSKGVHDAWYWPPHVAGQVGWPMLRLACTLAFSLRLTAWRPFGRSTGSLVPLSGHGRGGR